jgi:hypothetical protein
MSEERAQLRRLLDEAAIDSALFKWLERLLDRVEHLEGQFAPHEAVTAKRPAAPPPTHPPRRPKTPPMPTSDGAGAIEFKKAAAILVEK